MVLLGLILITACKQPATTENTQQTITETPNSLALPSPAYTNTPIPTPTNDFMRIIAPPITSEGAIPTPTPRPPSEPENVTDIIEIWPETVEFINLGDTKIDALSKNTGGNLIDGTFFHAYRFYAEAGQFVTLDLTSNKFDAILMLLNEDREIIGYNDDGDKTSTNAKLSLHIPMSGNYEIIVNSFGISEGEYTVSTKLAEHGNIDTTIIIGEAKKGWLISGDEKDENNFYFDRWVLEMPAKPIVVWVRSNEFDPFMKAYDEANNLFLQNGDIDRIAGNFNSRILLSPEHVPPGSQVTIDVTLQGAFSIGGEYEIVAHPLTTTFPEKLSVLVRPVIVKGENGEAGAEATQENIRTLFDVANEVWQDCNIEIIMENDQILEIEVPSLEYTIDVVNSDGWTLGESRLMQHETHAFPKTETITAYFVPNIDGDQRTGIAYPSTRYPGTASGLVLVGDIGVWAEIYQPTLAHEIGHLLGLNHQELIDGDPDNDTLTNLMFIGGFGAEPITIEEYAFAYDSITPLQCVIARSSPHFIKDINGEDVSAYYEGFNRMNRVLVTGESLQGSLITRDDTLSEIDHQFLDVVYFYGYADEEVSIHLNSTDFDPVLILDSIDGERLFIDDDAGEGMSAEIQFSVPENGDYAIGITSYEPYAVGAYTLTISEAK